VETRPRVSYDLAQVTAPAGVVIGTTDIVSRKWITTLADPHQFRSPCNGDPADIAATVSHAGMSSYATSILSACSRAVMSYAAASNLRRRCRNLKVKSGHSVELLPCLSRNQLVQPPVSQTLPAIFRCTS
jgi:hypothetical protein